MRELKVHVGIPYGGLDEILDTSFIRKTKSADLTIKIIKNKIWKCKDISPDDIFLADSDPFFYKNFRIAKFSICNKGNMKAADYTMRFPYDKNQLPTWNLTSSLELWSILYSRFYGDTDPTVYPHIKKVLGIAFSIGKKWEAHSDYKWDADDSPGSCFSKVDRFWEFLKNELS